MSEEKMQKQPETLYYKIKAMNFLKNLNLPVVAVIRLQGVIGAVSSMKSGITLESVEEDIKKAFEIKRLKSVVLIINSPGGSPVQSELIFKLIRGLAKEKNVEVISFAEDLAASGGYWLLCAGDEIYASENSIIGSIGVISAGFGFVEAIKKIGIERRIFTQGKNKSILDPFSEQKAEDVEIIKSLQKDIHQSFKNLVKERRENKLKAEEDVLFNGEFWTGTKALEYGLIDYIGNMNEVIDAKYGKEIKIKKIGKQKSWLQRKFGLSNIFDKFLDRIIEASIWQKFGI